MIKDALNVKYYSQNVLQKVLMSFLLPLPWSSFTDNEGSQPDSEENFEPLNEDEFDQLTK